MLHPAASYSINMKKKTEILSTVSTLSLCQSHWSSINCFWDLLYIYQMFKLFIELEKEMAINKIYNVNLEKVTKFHRLGYMLRLRALHDSCSSSIHEYFTFRPDVLVWLVHVLPWSLLYSFFLPSPLLQNIGLAFRKWLWPTRLPSTRSRRFSSKSSKSEMSSEKRVETALG